MPRLSHGQSPFETIVSVSDLTAGMDRQQHPSLLRSDQSVITVEWTLNNPGRLRTRAGFVNFVNAEDPNYPHVFPLLGGARVYLRDVDPFTVVVQDVVGDGELRSPSDDGLMGNGHVAGLDPTAAVNFTYDPQLVAFFNGVDTPQKSQSGTAWSRLGKSQPAAPVLSGVPGGSLITGNEYEIVVTWRENELAPPLLHEGPPSPVASHTPGANQTIRVDRPPLPAGENIAEWVIYARNVTAGESTHRRVAVVPIATLIFDITENVWFPNGVPAPFGNDPAALFEFGAYWNGRWWTFDPERPNVLRFSNLFDGQSWPGTNNVELPFERGDTGSAIVPYGDTLLLFGTNNLGLLVGETATEFVFRLLPNITAGAIGPRAAVVVEGTVVHAAHSGIFLFDGASDRELSLNIADEWLKMIQTTEPGVLRRLPMVFDHLQHELRIAVPQLPPLPAFMTPDEFPEEGAAGGEWVLFTQRMRSLGGPVWALTKRPTSLYIHWNGNENTAFFRGRLLRADARSWEDSGGATVSRLWDENRGTQLTRVTADIEDVLGPLRACYQSPIFSTGFLTTRQLGVWGEVVVFGGGLNFQPTSGEERLGVQFLNFGEAAESVPPYGDPIPTYGTATRLYGAGLNVARGVKPFFMTLPLEAEGTNFGVELCYEGSNAFEFHRYAWGIVQEPVPRLIFPELVAGA